MSLTENLWAQELICLENKMNKREDLANRLAENNYTHRDLNDLEEITIKINEENKGKPLPEEINLCPADRVPKIGEWIYVSGSASFDHGHDDVVGGLAQVCQIKEGKSGGEPVHFVRVKEHGHRGGVNWEQHLAMKQDELAKTYGYSFAYPSPDYNNYYDPTEWKSC